MPASQKTDPFTPHSTDHRPRTIAIGLVTLLALTLAVPLAAAAQFKVTSLADAIPAPSGTLRWAIERSEANDQPDSIEFSVFGEISLVAPLPALTAGQLTIGTPPPAPGFAARVALAGSNAAPTALEIRSAGNHLFDLDFVRFTQAALRVVGPAAERNEIAFCRFGTGTASGSGNGTGLEIAPADGVIGEPQATLVRSCSFQGNGTAIAVKGSNGPFSEPRLPTRIVDCDVGTVGTSVGAGNGDGLVASAPVDVEQSRFGADAVDNTARGIVLAAGANDSRVVRSLVGATNDAGACARNFGPAGIFVENATGVVLEDNRVQCNAGDGVRLGPGTHDALVRHNTVGVASTTSPGPGTPGLGNRRHGIAIDGAQASQIIANRLEDNAGYGLFLGTGAAGQLVACNEFLLNGSGPIFKALGLVDPPQLTSATPVVTIGTLPDTGPGWVDLYSASHPGGAERFLGSAAIGQDLTQFRARLAADGVAFARDDLSVAPHCVSFEIDGGNRNTATWFRQDLAEVSVVSDEIANPLDPRAHDLVRGHVENLARLPDGRVDLGPLECVAANVQPAQLPICDGVTPSPGRALYYLAVRRDLATAERGSYDPPRCGPFPTGQVGTRAAAGVCH